jgi:Ca2+-binding RTX toxin-like protein
MTTSRSRRISRASRAAALLAGVGAMALAAPAQATTAAVRDGVLEIQGGSGKDLVGMYLFDAGGPVLAVFDQYKMVTAGPGCRSHPAGPALCALDAIGSVDVHLGAGNDMVIAQSDVPVTAYGEDGDDTMTTLALPGGPPQAPVTFDGGPGADHLGGGAAGDVLRGGPGDDGIDGYGGDDTVDPGPGRDAVADSAGDDVIAAADGEPDFVDCGPGRDTGVFDVFDHAEQCELGQLPATHPDCTPQISGPAAVRLAHLRRTRVISVDATAAAGCSLSARLSDGDGTLLGRAGVAAGPPLRIALPRGAMRHLRRGARLSLVVEGRAADAPAPRRQQLLMMIV